MTAYELCSKIKANVGRILVGKETVIDFSTAALLTEGHVLMEDVPGSGKTVLSKAFAISLGCSFRRLQFTPDLLPSDITGIRYFNMKKSEFEFIPGPAFSNILLADEINRATPKTQAGLLECMEERQITVEGETHSLSSPFMVIATQNPVESMGVFPLPEAQLDRFMMKLTMGYPTHGETTAILARRGGSDPLKDLDAVITKEDIITAQQEVENVFVHPDLYDYIATLCEATRFHKDVILGVSTRGCIALMKAAKGLAALQNRSYVLPDDVKAAAVPVLAHRLVLKTSLLGKKNADAAIIKEILAEVTVPTEDFDRYRL